MNRYAHSEKRLVINPRGVEQMAEFLVTNHKTYQELGHVPQGHMDCYAGEAFYRHDKIGYLMIRIDAVDCVAGIDCYLVLDETGFEFKSDDSKDV